MARYARGHRLFSAVKIVVFVFLWRVCSGGENKKGKYTNVFLKCLENIESGRVKNNLGENSFVEKFHLICLGKQEGAGSIPDEV